MGLLVIEQRPVGHVTANQSMFTLHVCIIPGISHRGEGLFAVCAPIRQGERKQLSSTNRHIPHIQAVGPSQPRKEENSQLEFVCTSRDAETIDKNGLN